MATLAAALRAGDAADDLDAASETLDRTGYTLPAAEAAICAYTRHARAGRRVRASRSLLRARALADECAGARTPLLALDGVGTVLTPRELQVARLAAAGKTASVIAAQLGLSPRTVNNHLARTYDKLGTRGRGELRVVFADR
jgi:DNA-binding CsgD family transcriptional regulator